MAPRPGSSTPHSPPPSSTSSNLRLFFIGLLLALVSILYPRLPLYLPPSVSRHLPFLPTLPSTAHHTTWTNLQRYQHGVPLSPDYDPFDLKGQEEEYQLRVGSKEGGKEQEKQLKRQRREIERRTEGAGMENQVHRDLPVYFLQQGSSEQAIAPNSPLGQTLSRIGDEILDKIQPKTIIFLSPLRTTTQHIQISTLSSLPFSTSPTSLSVPGNPTLAQHLLTVFAHSNPPVHATSSSEPLSPPAWPVYQALFGGKGADQLEVVLVSLPVKGKGMEGGAEWSAEKWDEVGRALGKVRREEEDVVIIGLGSARPSNPSPQFPSLLHTALTHSTSHPRHASLTSLFANAGGAGKPTSRGVQQSGLVGLYAAVGAAGEGEGHALDPVEQGGRGSCWRFGELPVR